MANLSRLEEIKDLRTVWPHEALDFTPWLSQDDNIKILADAVGLDITIDEIESSVGDFHVDIFASETDTNRKIIIENQLEDTNHEHLGKLITYASGKSAEVIIWVVKHAREEHKAAIEWLNNHTDEKIGFFLCEIKLYRIGNSEPAVKFDVIEKPNDWAKEVKKNIRTHLVKLAESSEELRNLYDTICNYIESLGDDISDSQLKFYKAYKRIQNFVCIEIYKKHILLNLKLDPATVDLKEGFINDMTNKGHFGTGDLQIVIKTPEDFIQVKSLLDRAYNEG